MAWTKEQQREYKEKHREQQREYGRKHAAKHREQISEYHHKWRAEHREQLREQHFVKSYGITTEQWEQRIVEQGHRCPLCNTSYDANGHRPCVDHNHETGQTRDIICHHCNVRLLPTLERSKELIQAAMKYLDKYGKQAT